MEEYRQFLHTKKNSWNISVFAAILFLIAGVVDIVLLIVLAGTNLLGVTAIADPSAMTSAIQGLIRLGIGASAALIPLSPLMLLFSYNRTHKNSWIDIAIPIAGIVLIVLVYIEFIYQVILQIPSMLGF